MSIEVLSPAGSPDALIAALRAGADAVYFGTGNFNARKNATNFDDGAVIGAVASCHRQNTAAYITMNTLISDKEIPQALRSVSLLCEAGADGVIVADLGLAALIRKAAPSLRLHASTQIGVHSPSALLPLKKLGFTRVVAAREMNFSELNELCAAARKLDMEVEVFVHGALCMCVSGSCYMSAFLGGRSGNRGLCAQPCRLPFSVNNGTGYDLSLKDLSLIDRVDELKGVGVASLKIEGRMKRPEYVAAATAAFRHRIDDGSVPEDIQTALENVFQRGGFTDGYFIGKTGRSMFGRRTDRDMQISKDSLTKLHALYRSERRCVPISAEFDQSGENARLTFSDGINTVIAEAPLEAGDRPQSKEFIESKISRLGGTNYFISEFKFIPGDNKYISAAELSRLRGDLVASLDTARTLPAPHKFTSPDLKFYVNKKASGKPPLSRLVLRFDNAGQIPDNIGGVYAVSLPAEGELENIEIPGETQKWLDIPRAIFGKEEYILERMTRAKSAGFTSALCGNPAAVGLAAKAGLRIVGDFGLNIFNTFSADIFKELGGEASILSPELTLNQIAQIRSEIPLGSVIYGRMPLMMTRNCPVKNGAVCKDCGRRREIVDRKGVSFPVRCRLGCSEILNSVPIWMADRMDELKNLDFGLINFTTETAGESARIISAYRSGGTPPPEFTRGLFYRGVE